MADNSKKHEIYAQYRKDLLVRQLSNSESLDKAVLSLSTAFLGLSLTFIRDITPVESTVGLCLLISSWGLFCIAIVGTLASFSTSQFGIKKQLEYAEKFYLENKEEFFNKPNPLAKVTDFLNLFSSICFILAVLFTTAYVGINLITGG